VRQYFPALFAQLQERLPNAAITAVYGSTEAEPIAHVNLSALFPQDHQAMARGHGLLAGKPITAIDLAILPDRAGSPVAPFTEECFAMARLPVNSVGEIVVSGAHVQKAYMGGDDGITKFRVGETIWHRTGDAGYLDSFGRLWLLGRSVGQGGEGTTVRYPFGIEAAAMTFAGVERAAYVEVNGEGILAVQAARQQWTTLVPKLHRALPAVTRIARVAAIPVDARHGSKVRYGALRAQLMAETKTERLI
ncbi:MAG TPA: AMP-binding protein, partial [Caldilineaceae bacterium]|nr:AMP-binding protein [Caldilineaceae bacterium]